MAKGENEYTNNDRFVEAFRKFNKYDDKWVDDWFEVGEALAKADDQDSGWGDDGFQKGV